MKTMILLLNTHCSQRSYLLCKDILAFHRVGVTSNIIFIIIIVITQYNYVVGSSISLCSKNVITVKW